MNDDRYDYENDECLRGTRFLPTETALVQRIEQGFRRGECVDGEFFMLPTRLLTDRKAFIRRFSTGFQTDAAALWARCTGSIHVN